MTWSCELGITRPWPRTVRSIRVKPAHRKKMMTKVAISHSNMFDAARGFRRVVRSSRWVPCIRRPSGA